MDGEDLIRRARDGRPYIKDPVTGKEILHSRISTFAKALADGAGLCAWKGRMAYLGLSQAPGLLGQEEREAIDQKIAIAMDIAGANDAAKLGTGLHGLTEIMDNTDKPLDPAHWDLPPQVWTMLDQYVEVTKDLKMVAAEGFVVVDRFKVAGSYDRVAQLPDGRRVILDLKTGALRLQEHAIQLAMYANGLHYDPVTGQRFQGPLWGLDKTLGLIAHVPADPKNGEPSLVGVDLTAGLEMALLAEQVRKARSRKVVVNVMQREEER